MSTCATPSLSLSISSSLPTSSSSPKSKTRRLGTLQAIAVWYCAGVLCISSSKILLSAPYDLAPLLLSFIQFASSSVFLSASLPRKPYECDATSFQSLAGVSMTYGCGFVLTSLSFELGSPPFVETIKSSEPLTSAAVAFASGADLVSLGEAGGLGIIASGAILAATTSEKNLKPRREEAFNYNVHRHGRERHTVHPIPEENSKFISRPARAQWSVAGVVMLSNLCFSLRGMYQKRLGANNAKRKKVVLNGTTLQYWMNRISALATLPILLLFRAFPRSRPLLAASLSSYPSLLFLLAANSACFCAYNLASTVVLDRVSMLQHAAVNAMRRVFAVLVTSLVFGILPSARGMMGLCMCLFGFGVFTYLKGNRKMGKRKRTQKKKLLPDFRPAKDFEGRASF